MSSTKSTREVKLKPVREEVGDAISGRFAMYRTAQVFVTIVFLIGGSFLAAVAALGAGGFSTPQYGWVFAAIVGSLLAAAGNIFLFFTSDRTDPLGKSYKALTRIDELAEEHEQLLDEHLFLYTRARQLRALYLSFNDSRSVFEQALAVGPVDEEALLTAFFDVVKDLVVDALGFEEDDTWTLVVYRRELDANDGKTYLRCVQHHRSIPCSLKDARRWREGVGVAGMALAKNDEVSAPDILASAAGSLFSLNGNIVRPQDLERYRSMHAVPVQVGNSVEPWGVVLASSSAPYHFDPIDDYDDVIVELNRAEALRALAGQLALALSIINGAAPTGTDRNLQ